MNVSKICIELLNKTNLTGFKCEAVIIKGIIIPKIHNLFYFIFSLWCFVKYSSAYTKSSIKKEPLR